MQNIKYPLSVLFSLTTSLAFAQYYRAKQQSAWIRKAEEYKPHLQKTVYHPVQEVTIEKDANVFQGFKAVKFGDIKDLYVSSFKQKKTVAVDFGQHLVGKVSFKIKDIGSMQDAVLCFKVMFGEVPSDLELPIEPFTRSLSQGWLQDFVCDVSYDGIFTFNCRSTAQYMKIEAVETSIYSGFYFDNITFEATTSTGDSKTNLAAITPQIFKDIARVSENTLKGCMQGVFEDVPKRDQRLWTGGLYLQSLANSVSYKEYNLTKRCLYLLIGLSNPENGLLYSNLVEYPTPHAQRTFFVDYALSFLLTLEDYYEATGDKETTLDLWPVVNRQIQAVLEEAIDKNWLYSNTNYQFPGMMVSIMFLDWATSPLDTHAAMQGYLAYVINRTNAFALKIGRLDDVKTYPTTVKKLHAAGRKKYWDANNKTIESDEDRQSSYAGTSWTVIGDLILTNEAHQAITNVMADEKKSVPGTPYSTHSLIEAMLHCGIESDARQYVENYWGGIVRLGTDTFWEYNIPDNQMFSTYNGYTLLNSYCHAWICTPIYFIINYQNVFQK